MKKFSELLKELHACSEAKEWAGEMTIEEVVEKCERGDWLLWLAQKVGVDHRKLTLAKGHCANTVRHLMRNNYSKRAVDAAILYGEGRINDVDLDSYANAAYDNAESNSDYAAAYAASSYTTSAYACANAVSYATAARKQNQRLTADICRNIIGKEIIEKVNELLK